MRSSLLLAAAVLALPGLDAPAATFAVGGEWVVAPWGAPYGALGAPWWLYDGYRPCLSPSNCPDYEQMRRFLERYERNYGGRFAPDAPVAAVPAQPRNVPPTPEAQIQPAYRGASQLRPAYRGASQLRPEFAPGARAAAPSRRTGSKRACCNRPCCGR
jgi:hypothetical protein